MHCKRVFCAAIAAAVAACAAAQGSAVADSTDFLGKGVMLPEVEKVGNANRRSNSSSLDAGVVKLDKENLLNLPTMTGEPDIIRAFAMQPGVSEGVEGFSGLYVRGGGNDQNLILLNGVPLYQISHLGGLFSSFNVEVVDNATFYKQAFPAIYGGRLSSVVDITTRKPDFHEYHVAATLGLTAGMLHLTGPLLKGGKTAFDVSVRRSWFDVISAPALAILNAAKSGDGKKTIARYAFTDVNARIDHRFDPANTLQADFYWGSDLLKFGSKEFSPGEEDSYFEQNTDKLRWGNTMAALSWHHTYNSYMKSTITAAFTRYKSTYGKESIDQADDEREEAERTDRNRIDDLSLFARWQYKRSNYDLRFGSFYTWHNFMPSAVEYESTKSEETTALKFSDYRIHAHEVGAYADFAWEPVHWFGVDAGMRLAAFDIYDKWHTSVEPRLLLRFTPMPGFSIKANYARMAQVVQQVSDSYVNLPTDSWMPVGRGEDLLTSDQVGGGLYYDTSDGKYSVALEGYYKWLDGVAEVNVTLNYKLSDRIELNASWVFATGNRMTVPVAMYQGMQDAFFPSTEAPAPNRDSWDNGLGLNYYTNRNNVRLPAYHRLDISASFTRRLSGGRKGVWRVGLYNAYCHFNPITVRRREWVNFNGERPWDVYYETFSIFPVIPNVSYTYYF